MNITLALMKALGWQGGTVHQLAQETGLDVSDIIAGIPKDLHNVYSDYVEGWYTIKVCPPESRGRRFSANKGKRDFWRGVIEAECHSKDSAS